MTYRKSEISDWWFRKGDSFEWDDDLSIIQCDLLASDGSQIDVHIDGLTMNANGQN